MSDETGEQDQVQALDQEFGQMAVEVGMHAWSVPQLTMREKAFVFLAADLCTANVGFALMTHVQMAAANGVSAAECAAAIRHLAPYAGYPTAAVALQQLSQSGSTGQPPSVADAHVKLPQQVFDELVNLDADFAQFFENQFNRRWLADDLSPRERALCCVATDVLIQTLDESFALHVDLATAAGAGRDQIKAVLLLVSGFGMAKAWRAYRALAAL